MKKILLIATGGTIASRYTPEGLSPSIAGEEMLSYCPDFTTFCMVITSNFDSYCTVPRVLNFSRYHTPKKYM